jgi:glutamyl-tRNA synthetase
MIYQALEWEQPTWIHLSLFLNPSGKGKLSKRHAIDPKSGVKSVYTLDLKEMGYLPEAVNNWCALMGWSYDDHTEVFPMSDLIEKFSLDKLSSSPAAVNFSKLDHFDGLYIRELPTEDLQARVLPFFENAGFTVDLDKLKQITPLIQERIRTLDEAVEMAGFFFLNDIQIEPELLLGKNMNPGESANAAQHALEVIQSSSSMDAAIIEPKLRALAEELSLKAGQLFGILRIAVTGQRVSPPLMESMEIIGKAKVIERIQAAIDTLTKLDSSS